MRREPFAKSIFSESETRSENAEELFELTSGDEFSTKLRGERM